MENDNQINAAFPVAFIFLFPLFFLEKKGQIVYIEIFSADNEIENVDLQNALQNSINTF